MTGVLRILPLFAPRVVRMTTGRSWSVVPCVPPEPSYSSTWSATNCIGFGSYSPLSGMFAVSVLSKIASRRRACASAGVWGCCSGVGVVVVQAAAELAGGLGLGQEFGRLGLGGLDGVRAGDEAL